MCAAPLPADMEGMCSGRDPTTLASAALLCKPLAAPLPAKASQGTYDQDQVHPLLRALHCFTWFKYRSYKKEGEGEGAQRRQELLHAAVGCPCGPASAQVGVTDIDEGAQERTQLWSQGNLRSSLITYCL